jgi:DNA-binding protein WhiA
MAMTGVVKDELSRVQVIKPCCRKAEVSTLLRFAGGLHLSEGRVVIEAELDTGAVARPSSSCSRRAACARATATWCG